MLEFIRKSLLTGFGLVIVTRRKLQEATEKLVNEGKMSQDEAEKLIAELLDEGSRQWEDVRKNVNDMVRQSFDALDIGSKKEFVDLQEKVNNLEKHITLLEDRLSAGAPGDSLRAQ